MTKNQIVLTALNNYKKSSTVTIDGEKKRVGKDVFVYEMDGADDIMNRFKASITAQGQEIQYSENKKVLFWSSRVLGDVALMEESAKTAGQFNILEPIDIISLRNIAESHQKQGNVVASRIFWEKYADAYTKQYAITRLNKGKSVAVTETQTQEQESEM